MINKSDKRILYLEAEGVQIIFRHPIILPPTQNISTKIICI